MRGPVCAAESSALPLSSPHLADRAPRTEVILSLLQEQSAEKELNNLGSACVTVELRKALAPPARRQLTGDSGGAGLQMAPRSHSRSIDERVLRKSLALATETDLETLQNSWGGSQCASTKSPCLVGGVCWLCRVAVGVAL